jgi:hypothetical protein
MLLSFDFLYGSECKSWSSSISKDPSYSIRIIKFQFTAYQLDGAFESAKSNPSEAMTLLWEAILQLW